MASATPFGGLLRQWRGARRLSQLELALSADVSSRHLSYMETGRARPSRAMVLQLAGALDVPLRERNTLLHAAGYAPVYGETPLEDPALSSIREALALLLRHHEPLPAVALDRRWFTTLTTLGAAQDLTLHELRIEAYHPADEESAERLAALRAG